MSQDLGRRRFWCSAWVVASEDRGCRCVQFSYLSSAGQCFQCDFSLCLTIMSSLIIIDGILELRLPNFEWNGLPPNGILS